MESTSMNRCNENEKRILQIEIKLTEISGDVRHIKERIDNGMSKTVCKIWDKLNIDIIPTIVDNSYWVGKLKWGLFYITVTCVCGGISTLIFMFIKERLL